MTVIHFLELAGAASAMFSGFLCLLTWKLKRQIEANEAAQRRREEERMEFEFHQIKMTSANAALAKANAIALKNGHCNGETTAALAYLEEVKHDQRDFLMKHGVVHIYEKL
jgi:hypothetical protein